MSRHEEGERILQQVFELPEPLRMTAMLFYLGDCSVQEVAELLEVKLGTVKKRLHDARERLGARLVERGIAMGKDGLSKRDTDHGTTPLTWARFFLANLEQDSPVLPSIIAYLEQCERTAEAERG